MSIVSVWSTKVILHSPHMSIARLLISCAFLFRLFFRGKISHIATVFVSDFSNNAKSMTDLDIWLAVLLLLSSFAPTCNIRWFELNSQMVGWNWWYIQLTVAPLNDLTLISFLFRNFFVKRYPFKLMTIPSPSINTVFLVLLTCLTWFSLSSGLLLPPLLKLLLSLSLFELKLSLGFLVLCLTLLLVLFLLYLLGGTLLFSLILIFYSYWYNYWHCWYY